MSRKKSKGKNYRLSKDEDNLLRTLVRLWLESDVGKEFFATCPFPFTLDGAVNSTVKLIKVGLLKIEMEDYLDGWNYRIVPVDLPGDFSSFPFIHYSSKPSRN